MAKIWEHTLERWHLMTTFYQGERKARGKKEEEGFPSKHKFNEPMLCIFKY